LHPLLFSRINHFPQPLRHQGNPLHYFCVPLRIAHADWSIAASRQSIAPALVAPSLTATSRSDAALMRRTSSSASALRKWMLSSLLTHLASTSARARPPFKRCGSWPRCLFRRATRDQGVGSAFAVCVLYRAPCP
jgi:hypothetical protein